MKSFMRRILFRILSSLVLILSVTDLHATKNPLVKPVTGKDSVGSLLSGQPVLFLENRGQMLDMQGKQIPQVLFLVEVSGLNLYVTTKGLSYVFLRPLKKDEAPKRSKALEFNLGMTDSTEVQYERLDLELPGAAIRPENIVKTDADPSVFNYLRNPVSSSIYGVKKYGRVLIENVYPGIDWVLYSSSAGGFKYDFIVHPGADASLIRLLYRNAQKPEIDAEGNILLKTNLGELLEKKPYCYLRENEVEQGSSFKLISQKKQNGRFEAEFGFEMDIYDRNKTLVIDPLLVWCTFFGTSAYERAFCADTDSQGNLVITGICSSGGLPLQNNGSYYLNITCESYISKFSNSGLLLWSTYFDAATRHLEIDVNDNLYICGFTSAGTGTNFPLLNAGGYYQGTKLGQFDATISRFDAAGNLTWSTYYGGSNSDDAFGMTSDQNGNVFVSGHTRSSDFPVLNAGTYFDGTLDDSQEGFVLRFNSNTTLTWATYFRDVYWPTMDIAPNGHLCMAATSQGPNIPLLNAGGYFVGTAPSFASTGNAGLFRFTNTGNLLWGTYYGGSSIDEVHGIACDSQGNMFVVGWTDSPNFPLQNAGTFFQSSLNAQNVFILKFNPQTQRTWATLYGGSGGDKYVDYFFDPIAIDTCDNVFVGFVTTSTNIPVKNACGAGFYDSSKNSLGFQQFDMFLTRFRNDGQLDYASYIGGDGQQMGASLALDHRGDLFMSGAWSSVQTSTSYPLVNPGGGAYYSNYSGSDDIFLLKLDNHTGANSFSFSGSYCKDALAVLPTQGPAFNAGGTFSAAPGLSLNPVTGQMNPGASQLGTYTITYISTLCACQGPTVGPTGTATVTIASVPVLTITGKTSVCVGDKVLLTASGASQYSWTNVSSQPSYSFIPFSLSPVTLTLTGTETNSCSATKIISVTIKPCTGISESSVGPEFLIYPNPNNGGFIIQGSKKMSLLLVNELGQIIREVDLQYDDTWKVQLNNIPKGIYFLREKGELVGTRFKIVVTD